MIKFFKVKDRHREIAESANGRELIKKQSVGALRLRKGLTYHIDLMIVFFFLLFVCPTFVSGHN